jgi:hypothetical protein
MKLFHKIKHWLHLHPCELVEICHDQGCSTQYGIAHGCCKWKAGLHCVECGKEQTI